MEKTKKKRRAATEEKKRLILNAAVHVFAEKGFHRCRISDIATRAGVAYGLVYHYFDNKEAILNTIFEENWGLLDKVIDNAAEQSSELREKLRAVVAFILDAHQLAPDIIQVMVIEIARSSKFLKKPKLDAYERVFSRLAEVLAQHQSQGELDSTQDPKLLAYSFFGSLELILTGYLIHTLQPGTGDTLESIKSALVDNFLNGIRTSASRTS